MDGYPPKASWVRDFIKFYIPEVDKRLAKDGKYKINWNQAWAGQIVKTRHVLEGLQRGLGDIGIVTSVFHADKVPLQNLTFVTPFVTADPLLATRVMDDMAKEFPQFAEGWKPYNQVYLTNGCVLDSYQMFSKTEVTSMSGYKGQKIASAGINLRYLEGLGVAGVPGSLVNYYNMIKTGVVDGIMLWPESVMQFKIVEVAPYMLKADIGAACSKSITMNQDSWNKLPEEVRKVIADVAIGYRDVVASNVKKSGAGALEAYKKKGGKVAILPDDERKKWTQSMPNVAKEWAEGLEAKGIPGKTILAKYMDRMRAEKQPIMRHWDKE